METIGLILLGIVFWILGAIGDMFAALGTWKGMVFIGLVLVINELEQIRKAILRTSRS